jgi:hypothetical protein
MKQTFRQYWDQVPEKGGIIGALLGLFVSTRSHNSGDSTAAKAGKTALYTGTGYIAGRWIEKILRRSGNHF